MLNINVHKHVFSIKEYKENIMSLNDNTQAWQMTEAFWKAYCYTMYKQ